MFRREACPVCGSEAWRPHHRTENAVNRRCAGCGCVYLSERRDIERFRNIYDRSYYESSSHRYGYENYRSQREAIHRSADRRFGRIERLAGKKGHVLDIGCAMGYYLEAAQKRGWQVTGVDISSWAVENADPAMRPHLICGDLLQDVPLPADHFDCVTLWDVIEQTPDPARLLAAAVRALKPGGWAVMMFRDIGSAAARLFGDKWIHYRPEEKYVYLTGRSARILMERAGLRVARMERRGTGKDTTLANLAQKLEAYSKPLAESVAVAGRGSAATVYLNFWDTRIAYAQKL
jgi:SAM-dependent methyltransferase